MTDSQSRLTEALAGQYNIEREVGAGGMATVYLAHDVKHDRKVALKVLREDLSASLGGGRFLREIKIAAQLQHPHILPLLDSGEAAGLFYFVMPYIKGQSLRERIEREGELPVHEAVRLITEVVDALVEAHAHGVVHRDIKPDNVMLSGRHALVTDFGVAKAISEATGRNTVTTLGVAVGTPTYMSPEQAAADPHVDHRSDIYSVGVMAYEMLSGRPPFTGSTPQQVLAAHVTEAPDSVAKRRPAIPPSLEQIVMRCLAKRPADRFQTAAELHAALEPFATPSTGITPTQTAPVQGVGAPGARRPRNPVVWAGVAALLLAAIAVGWKVTRGAASGRIQRIGVMPIEDISRKDSLFVTAMHDALTNELSKIGTVGVASRSEMIRYKGSLKTTREIAAEQDLDAVVEATVFRADSVMRINVQFMDPVATRSLWATTYTANVSDVLKAQSTVVTQIRAGIDSALVRPKGGATP